MNMTGIFYGSTMGTTESVAREIAARLGVDSADIHNVADADVHETDKYDLLVLGSSTWGCGELQDDWYSFIEQLKSLDLTGKRVALFGCGDAGSYPDTFCDAVGILHEALAATGCTFAGAYDPEGYDAVNSLICKEGKFVGLAIDESNPAASDERIARWCELLK